jgi:hypothetical protein
MGVASIETMNQIVVERLAVNIRGKIRDNAGIESGLQGKASEVGEST